MKILYYLEPWVELCYPKFRYGSLKHHIRKQLHTLKEYKGPDIHICLSIGEAVYDAIQTEGMDLKFIDSIKVIPEKDLKQIFPNYKLASQAWYRGTYYTI